MSPPALIAWREPCVMADGETLDSDTGTISAKTNVAGSSAAGPVLSSLNNDQTQSQLTRRKKGRWQLLAEESLALASQLAPIQAA